MSKYSDTGNHPSNLRTAGRNPRESKQQKTFAELITEIRQNYFKETYKELLNLNKSKHLDKIFEETERFAKEVGSNLSTHQLRRIYSEIIKVKGDDVASLKMLRPHLAYMAARQDKEDAKKVMALLDDLIKQVQSEDQLNSMKQFAEALVAYHKFYGKSN